MTAAGTERTPSPALVDAPGITPRAVVAVVGSANLDLVAYAERAPEAGETVLGNRFSIVEGGKGANQAIAAAAHAPTAFVGCVGDDDAGRRLRDHLAGAGVHIDRVAAGFQPSGHALITVAGDGENRIVVVPGANLELTAATVIEALDHLQPAAVLYQLEIPLDAVTAAAQWARAHGAISVLNPSPVRALPPELLDLVDVLVVNTGEAQALLSQRAAAQGRSGQHDPALHESSRDESVQPSSVDPLTTPTDPETPMELAEALRSGDQIVVVTAGADGVACAEPRREPVHVAAQSVRAFDTTGAGDTFAGALTGLLARGVELETCVREANAAAARIVSMPREQR